MCITRMYTNVNDIYLVYYNCIRARAQYAGVYLGPVPVCIIARPTPTQYLYSPIY